MLPARAATLFNYLRISKAMRLIGFTVLLIVILIASLSTQAAAFSELIIDENFSVDYGHVTRGQDCGLMSQAYMVETITTTQSQDAELKKVDELVWKSRQMLISARLAWERQHNFWLMLIPGLYDSLGYYCVQSGTQSMRLGIGAARVVGKKIDQKLDEIDFEIGNENFQGSATRTLREGREAYNGTGKASAGIIEANAAVREAVEAIQSGKNAADATGKSSGRIISKRGAIYQLLQFYSNVTQAIAELSEEENSLDEKLQTQKVEVENKIQNLKKKGAGQIGLWETEQIKQYTINANGVLGLQVEGSSVAELVEDAENNLQKAESLRLAPKSVNRGRTSRRIKSLRSALEKTELALTAVDRAEKTFSALLAELQQRAIEERRKAQQAIADAAQPTRRKAAEAIISTPLPRPANQAQQIMQLGEEIKRSQQAAEIAQEEYASLKARSALKSRADEIAKRAQLAEKDGIEGSEIARQAIEISKTVDKPLKPEDLMEINSELNDLEGELAEKLEEKYGSLRSEVEKLQLISNANLLKPEDEASLREMRNIFRESNLLGGAGKLQNAEKKINEISIRAEQAILAKANTSATTALFPISAISYDNTLNFTKTKQNSQNQLQQAEAQQIFLTDEIESAIQNIQDEISAGITAFYTDKIKRKSLQEISFDNARRKAEKLSRDVEKLKQKPLTQAEAEKVKNVLSDANAQADVMKTTIDETESQASLEIAIASQKAIDNQTAAIIQSSQTLMGEGKFTQALLLARDVNKRADSADAQQRAGSAITGAAVSSTGADYKQWAVAGSVAIILLGAAYLYLTKKKNDTQPS